MSRLAGKTGNILVGSDLIFNCETAFNEQVIANVTASLSDTDVLGGYKVGNGSSKFAVAAAFATGLIGSKAISSIDLSSDTELMFWVKSDVALNAGDWQILLDNTALCPSPVVSLDIPALSANTWTFVKIAANLSGCGAIISVGLSQVVDKGSMNFWVDEIRAAKAVPGMKSWTLDYLFDNLDVTGFDSGSWRQYVPLISYWSGSFEGFKDGAPLTIGAVVAVELQESATATQQYRGSAIVKGLHTKTNIDGVVSYSYDFQGIHSLVIASS